MGTTANRHLLLKFAILLLLWAGVGPLCGALMGQEYSRSARTSVKKVRITFMLVSERLKGNALLLDHPGLNGTIDMTKYPDAKVHVKIEGETLLGYAFQICNSCFSEDVEGFTFVNMRGPRRFTGKGETVIIYDYNPKNVNNGQPNELKLALQVIRSNDPDEVLFNWNLSSASYTLIPPSKPSGSSQAVNIDLENLRLYNKQMKEALRAGDNARVNHICEELKRINRDRLGNEVETLNELLNLCARRDNLNGSDDAFWADVQRRARAADGFSEQKNIFNEYLKKYAAGSHINEARAAIRKIEEEEEALLSEEQQEKEKERVAQIAEQFQILEEQYEEQGGQIVITLKYLNSDGAFPELNVGKCKGVLVENQKAEMRSVLTVEKGVECTLEAALPGVSFTEGNNQYRINTKTAPLTTIFEPMEDGSVLLRIKGGEPPFQLCFLRGESIVGVMDITPDGQGQYKLEKQDPHIPGSGAFTLQVVDKTGNRRAEARSGSIVLSEEGGKSELRKIMLLLFFVLIGAIIYLIYRKHQL